MNFFFEVYKTTFGDYDFKSFINIFKITVVLQFSLEPQLVIIISKLFLIHPYFNSIMILILFLKFFYRNNHKTILIKK